MINNIASKVIRISVLTISFTLGMLTDLVANNLPYASGKKKLTQAISDYYLPSISTYQTKSKETLNKKKHQHIWEAELPSLTEQEKATILFNNIFGKSSVINSLEAQQEHILNSYAWHDLKLFYGNNSAPDYHLLNRINKTTTLLGKVALAILLATPTTDIKELCTRQHIIRILLEDEAIFYKLKKVYEVYVAIEDRLLSLWSEHDPLYNSFYKSFIQQQLYFGSRTAEKYNKSSKSLELRKRFYFDFVLALHGASIGFQGYYLFKVLTDQPTFKRIISKDHPIWIRVLAWYPLATIPMEILSIKKHYDSWATPLHYLAIRLADIQAWINAAKEVDNLVASCPELENLYGKYLINIRELLNQPKNTELGKLIMQLSSLSLKNWSVFFNNNGKLLQTYQLFLAYKDQLTDALYDFGKLDAFLSTAQLIREIKAADCPATYTFTQFFDHNEKQKPYISFTDLWNPFLDVDKAVTNSLVMDGEHGVRNIILTGPNAGGKSVFLTGVAISILLSQTLGIAPARLATITPLNKINTYLDISEDIASGKSLFMAEVQRAQEQLHTIAGLKNNEFSFSVMDEIFSGTNPKEGEAAAYSIIHYLTRYPNNLNIVATHFPRLTLLPERITDRGFANYKVSVGLDSQTGKLIYTYKVMPGKSDQTIALDILKEQGYDTRMLDEAKEILAHPERY